jgi:enoyl-[acyl-carrier protein] reductase III
MMTTVEINHGPGLEARVLGIFADVTRYPAEILDPEASLEEHLGIDSVKLGEIFSVLRESYQLPEKLDFPREQLKTISGITKALTQFLAARGQASGSPAVRRDFPAVTLPSPARRGGHGGDFQQQVQAIFAEVTRYPIDILDPDASLEEELGVDSVKLGEIFSVLRERFDLPAKLEVPREELKTIRGLAKALASYFADAETTALLQTPTEPESASFPLPLDIPFASLPAALTLEKTQAEVMQIFAEVTRYPQDVLDPAVSLEEELGIDSVKLGEVFSVLREKYTLPADMHLPRENLKSIAGVAEALHSYLLARRGPATVAIAEPVGKPHTNGNGASHRVPETSSAIPQSFAALKPELKPFAGKVAFISGSGRGIGKNIAAYLAQLGATVIVNSFHSRPRGEETTAEIKAAGGQAVHLWGSMANPNHVDEIFDKIEAQFGGLDFFISGASNGMLARLENITAEDWEKAFRTNVIGLHQGAMRSARLMRKRGGGKIITMSSPAAHGYVDYFGCMGAVKAAVESLTRSLAIELAPDRIQVNCVSPGPVYGELLKKWPESERLIKQWEGNTAYERLCEADDVSHFIAYLLSEPVKLFAGSVLVMDGGISAQGW